MTLIAIVCAKVLLFCVFAIPNFVSSFREEVAADGRLEKAVASMKKIAEPTRKAE